MVSEQEAGDEILEGADLCVGCLFPVRPGSELCVKCGAPHGAYSAVLPLLRVLAEGYVYRQAVQNPRSLMTVMGVWVIFGVHLLPLILVVPMYVTPEATGGVGVAELAVIAGVSGVPALVGLFAICQSTRNFQRRKRT